MPLGGRRLAAAGITVLLIASRAAAQSAPSLGAAASFAVFGNAGVVNSGQSHITGDVGAGPDRTISGFPPGTVTLGTIIADRGTLRHAQSDAAAAYGSLAARACTPLVSPAPAPGVYCVTSLGATLTLQANSSSDVWIFRTVNQSLTTPNGFSMLLRGGATSSNVFWQIDGSMTIGANSGFVGTVLAATDIKLLHGATMSGRALAPNGTVTLDTSDVTFCCNLVVFDPPSLPNQKVGEPYKQTITPTGGTPPYVVSIYDGSLPPGLTLTPLGTPTTSVTLSGTPTAHDDFTFTLLAVDAHGCFLSHYQICDTITLSLEPKSDPKACVPYTRDIVAGGGRFPYKFHASGLPPDLSLTPPDGKTIAGTPTAAAPGDYNITIDVTDDAGCTATATFPMHVACNLMLPPLSPLVATAGMQYHANIAPFCGQPLFTFSGVLPPGITGPSPTGAIDGMPLATGEFVFTVTVVDAVGCTDMRTYTLDVCAGARTDIVLPNGVVCTQYDSAPIPGMLVDPASLPPGLYILNGKLTGVPKKMGTYRFTIKLNSAPLCPADMQTYVITIDCPSLTLPDLQPLTAGVQMSQSLAPPFCLPFTWTISSGTVPLGLVFNDPGFAGILHGAPQPGDYNFCVTATAADSGCTAARCYPVIIPPPLCTASVTLSPASTLLASGTVGVFYTQAFTAAGGTPVIWQIEPSPSQPPGLTLTPNNPPTTATLSGFPTAGGRFNFAVAVTDAKQCTTSVVYTIDIGPPPMPMPPMTVPALSPWALLLLTMALVITAVIMIGRS